MNNNSNGQQQGGGYGPRVKVGGLYACTRQRDGATYFSGRFGFGARLLVMPNPDKVEGDSLPHYEVFIVEQQPKQDGQQQQRQAYRQGQQSGNRDASGYHGRAAWPVATGEPDMGAPLPSYPDDIE